MNDIEETLSAAFDGECSPAELGRLLDACDRSPQLLRRYGRYCASREAHAGGTFNSSPEALCRAVMSQIDPPRHARVVALRARTRAVMRPLGGFALAASLGALATFTAYRFGGIPPVTPALTQTASVGNVVASSVTPAVAPRVEVQWSQLGPGAARQLDDYMLEHASYRSRQDMGSAFSYARVAAQRAFQGPTADAGSH